jgi:hypothetical protein
MMKRGVKDLSVMVILLIISQVFGGVVSAVDVSEDFIGVYICYYVAGIASILVF